ncbi:hypothetical protein P692DRAFT_20180872, partial [Suillus brevipes Sb2]
AQTDTGNRTLDLLSHSPFQISGPGGGRVNYILDARKSRASKRRRPLSKEWTLWILSCYSQRCGDTVRDTVRKRSKS